MDEIKLKPFKQKGKNIVYFEAFKFLHLEYLIYKPNNLPISQVEKI